MKPSIDSLHQSRLSPEIRWWKLRFICIKQFIFPSSSDKETLPFIWLTGNQSPCLGMRRSVIKPWPVRVIPSTCAALFSMKLWAQKQDICLEPCSTPFLLPGENKFQKLKPSQGEAGLETWKEGEEIGGGEGWRKSERRERVRDCEEEREQGAGSVNIDIRALHLCLKSALFWTLHLTGPKTVLFFFSPMRSSFCHCEKESLYLSIIPE